MGLVTEVDDEGAPTVLIVDNNPMSSLRLSNLFKTRNFIIEHCEDGDQAVDEYIRLDPELVVLTPQDVVVTLVPDLHQSFCTQPAFELSI